jgi:hypothetical protein
MAREREVRFPIWRAGFYQDAGISTQRLIFGESGLTVRGAVLCAFDLIEADGADLRRQPPARRPRRRRVQPAVESDGVIVFQHACALGCEGIVSKRLGSHYRSGRVDHWLKIKNPEAPAVKRAAEEDWGNKRWARWRRL